MNSRRNFLLKGSLVTTALLSTNPFKSLANTLSPITGFSINSNKVVLLHTNKQTPKVMSNLAAIKSSNGNVVLLHAGETNQWDEAVINYDAAINQTLDNKESKPTDFSIIYKGNHKIGVITPADNGYDVEEINKLSRILKNEKKCNLVICLSNLGYKNSQAIDDVTLAASSIYLDIIIGGHTSNYSKNPVTVLNKNQEEVIINHSFSHGFDFGKIEIDFDNRGNKRNIVFNNA